MNFPFLLALTLLSTQMQHQGTAPQSIVAQKCGGSDLSPELHWSTVPAGTKSFAIAMYDPDARGAGFYQWVLYDIPSATNSIAAGTNPTGATIGTNGNGAQAYVGPCPPLSNKHHYATFIYALDVPKLAGGSAPLTGFDLMKAMKNHILGHAVLVVTYKHNPMPSPSPK